MLPTKNRVTFAALDRAKGLPALAPKTQDEWPLPAWYRKVYRKPFDQFSIEDIAKSCRQSIHVDEMLPFAITALEGDPLAGLLYDGELLSALISLPNTFWEKHADSKIRLQALCKRALNDPGPDDVRYLSKKLRRAVDDFISRSGTQ